MIEYNVSQSARLVVILKDTSALPIAGASYNGVSISIVKNNGQQFELIASSSNWSQITGAAYTNQGYYNYVLTSSYVDVTGIFQYSVVYTGSVPYFGVVKITDGDTGAIYNRIGVPISGTISNDIQNVPAAASSGGFTSTDRAMLSQTWATASQLPGGGSDVASNTHLDSAISASFWTGDRQNLQAIKAKTDNLPVDPASTSGTTTTVGGAQTAVNNNTNAGFNEIKGNSYGWNAAVDNLHFIFTKASATQASGSTQAFLSYTFATITGNGYVSGSDNLHALSIAIQGITPGSGGGGFSTADRDMLISAYSQTLPLPVDPASQAAVSGFISESRKQIRGEYPYGAGNGQSTASLSIYGLATASQIIYTKTQFIQGTSAVATTADIQSYAVSGVNVLAGPTFITSTSTLGGIYNALTASNFTAADRTMISSTLVSQSIIYSQEITTNANVLAVKTKTDNLPGDPVSTAHIDPQLNAIFSASAVSGGFSNTDRDNIVAIKAKTDNLPLQPADAQVTFGTSDRNVLNQVYAKTNNLPADPASTTYVTLVSQSLANAVLGSQANVSGAVSSSNNQIMSRLGIPVGASVSADIAAVGISAGNAYTAAQSADTHAQQATSQATAASAGTANIILTLGTPMSGTVSADISATYHAAVNVSATVSSSVGNLDLGPVLKILGKPVKTIAADIKETAREVHDISSKI